MSATVLHDEHIAHAATGSEQFWTLLREARAHCERVRNHIIETRGRAFAGELAAVPDLDRLLQQLVEAEHAVQDAELGVHHAQVALQRLKQQRPAIEREESLRYLAALLAHRAAWAARVDAAIDDLVATVGAYLVTTREADAMAQAIGIREDWATDATAPLADRVIYCLKGVVPTQFAGVPPRPPLAEADLELTKRARERVGR